MVGALLFLQAQKSVQFLNLIVPSYQKKSQLSFCDATDETSLTFLVKLDKRAGNVIPEMEGNGRKWRVKTQLKTSGDA